MPTYVYACKACDHQFEKFQSFTANALRTCPNCGEKALSKVIFPAGVVFKGSGFYVNDSKVSTAAGSKKVSSSDSSSDGSKKSESTSDTKSGDSSDKKSSSSSKKDSASKSAKSSSKSDD